MRKFIFLSSGLTAAIYAERMVFDLMVHGDYSFSNAIGSATVWFTFLSICGLLMLALFLDVKWIDERERSLKDLVMRLVVSLRSPTPYVVLIGIALVALLAVGIQTSDPIWKVLQNAIGEVSAEVVDKSREVLLIVLLIIALFVLRIVRNFLPSHTEVDIAVREFSLGGFCVAAIWALYLFAYLTAIATEVPEDIVPHFWRGWVKDSAIYVFVTLVLVVGLYRFDRASQSLPKLRDRWIVFLVFLSFAVLFILVGLVGDLYFIANISELGALEYPMQKQQTEVVPNHIMIRDFGLFIPLAVVEFTWLAGRISRSNAAESAVKSNAGDTKREKRDPTMRRRRPKRRK